jgi:hypothetical protein
MLAHQIQLPLYEGASERRSQEARTPLVRGVEYCCFPRAHADEGLRSGFTRDISPSGMCLRVESHEPKDQLLRIVVHRIDGRAGQEQIVRVAWYRPVRRGSPVHLMGVTFVEVATEEPGPMDEEPAEAFAS